MRGVDGQFRPAASNPGIRRVRWMAWAGAAVPVAVGLALMVVRGERWLIYCPDRSDPGPVGRYDPDAEDVEITTCDGLTLKAWLFRPKAGGNAKNVGVLYLPGVGGNRLGLLGTVRSMADRGYTVLLVDYRGYGGNPGEPSENGLARDARAAAAVLRTCGFSADRTIYVGESLGTSVAARLATTDPPAGIVLRSPFTKLADVARTMFWWFPGVILVDRFDTLAYLRHVWVPVTVLCGGADMLVPAGQSRTVADRVLSLHRFTEIADAGHTSDIWYGPYLADTVDDLASAVIAD